MHGGTLNTVWQAHWHTGLSPRARGNLADNGMDPVGEGSIPACTGEPSSAIPSRAPYRVYPRVHGGTAVMVNNKPGGNGLSPRARGNRAPICSVNAGGRSIPACTGEPRPSPIPTAC